jgi:hypothetical protein
MIEPTQLIGTTVLVGITHEHASGDLSQEQYAGIARVEDQDEYCLITLECTDGETRSYPFDSRALSKASPGEYRLRSTGETINNPDFLMTWTVTEGQPEE